MRIFTTILKTTLLTILMAIAINRSFAQTYISGIISGNANFTVSGSPYVLTGTTLVDSGVVLTINPGVVVKFNSHCALQINGTLRAIGIAGNKITFTSSAATPAAGDWDYIQFNPESVSYDTSTHLGSIMEYCVIQYGGGSNNAAVQINGCFPFINHCEFTNNANSGLGASYGTSGNQTQTITGTQFIINSWFHNNNNVITNYTGFSAWGGGIHINFVPGPTSKLFINNNQINNNKADLSGLPTQTGGGGIALTGYSNTGAITISNNSIYNNISTGNGGGIFSSGISNVRIFNDTIYNNNSSVDGGGIYFTGTNWWAGNYGNAHHNYIYNNTSGGNGGGICETGMTVKNNIIAHNTAVGTHGGVKQTTFGDPLLSNHIIDNKSSDFVASFANDIGTYNYNTITRNITTGALPTSVVDMSGSNNCTIHANCNNNNLFNNTASYEFNDSRPLGCDINCKNSYWGYFTTGGIDTVIYDNFDNSAKSIVYITPFAATPDTSAPVTPPTHVVKTDLGGGNVQLTWYANTEKDLAGYRIYYGNSTGFSFHNSIDVGKVTSYILNGVNYNLPIAVTAYDSSANGINDQLNTHESWFTNAVGAPAPSFVTTHISICKGDSIFYLGSATDAATWSWKFPGGTPSTSSVQNPVVVYNVPGVHSATLIVSNIAATDSVTYNNLITVHTMPVVSLASINSLCENANPITLVGSPAGGVYAGNNAVLANTFDPQLSGSGTFNISYIYNDSFGCGVDTAYQNVTVKPVANTIFSPTICQGDTFYFPDGYIATFTSTHIIHKQSYLQCDSVITYQVSMLNSSSSITVAGVCPGNGYLFNGNYYFNAGTFAVHFTNAVGCDSSAILQLSYNTTSTSTTTDAICPGDVYSFGGGTYTSAGTFTAYLTNYVGCDSTATLNLSVKPTSSSITDAAICQGDSIVFNGNTYTNAGNHIAHLTNYVGCDSAALLHLTINLPTTSDSYDTICRGGSIVFNGQTFSTSGVHTVHLNNYLGCDSSALLHLKVDSINLLIAQIGSSLNVSQGGNATYQWIDCANQQVIANTSSVAPPAIIAGHSYKCIINALQCTDTTQCILFNPDGIADVQINNLDIYPNPTSGTLMINSKSKIKAMEITNMVGQIVHCLVSTDQADNNLRIDTYNLPQGVYFIKATDINGTLMNGRFVKQ